MNNKVMPIKPSEVIGKKCESIPSEAMEAFNELIAQKFNGHYAHVVQKDVVKLMVEKGLKEAEIFEKGWLDVEDIYRKNGWIVEYDKPAYCESYDASFKFSVKKKVVVCC